VQGGAAAAAGGGGSGGPQQQQQQHGGSADAAQAPSLYFNLPQMAGAVAAGAAGALGGSGDAAVPTPVPSDAALAAVARVLGPLRRALELLAQHDARGALEALKELPQAQYETAEVLCLAGRAR